MEPPIHLQTEPIDCNACSRWTELQNGSVDLALDKILRVYITAALHSENSPFPGVTYPMKLYCSSIAQLADSIIVNGD